MSYDSLSQFHNNLVEEYKSTIEKLDSDLERLHRADPIFSKCKLIMNFFLETGIEDLIQYAPLHDLFERVNSKIITYGAFGEDKHEYILALYDKLFQRGTYNICLKYIKQVSKATSLIYEDQNSINNVLSDLARTHILNPIKFRSHTANRNFKEFVNEQPELLELVDFSLELHTKVFENWLSQKRINFALDTIDYIIEIYDLLEIPNLSHQFKMKKINLLSNPVNIPKMVTLLLAELNEFSDEGDLTLCNYIIDKILEYRVEFDELMHIDVLCEIGKIYRVHGEIEKSKMSFMDATEIAKAHNVDSRLSFCYQSLGNLESLLGNSKEAENWFKLSLETLQSQVPNLEELDAEHPIKVIISSVLFQLVRLCLSQDEFERADRYYRQLIATSDEDLDPRVKLSQALLLKSNKRLRDKMKGEQLLDELINTKSNFPEITSIALKHRIELLLLEYKLLGEEEVYLEIQDLLSQLQLISKNRSNMGTLINSIILSSRLYANTGEFATARDQLTELLNMPKTASFKYYEHEIINEIQQIDREFEDMEKKVLQNPEYNSKIKEMQVSNYLHYIQKMLDDQ